MASIFRTGQRLWLFVRGRRVAVRVQSHGEDVITISPGPDLVVQRGVVVPIGCPMPHGFMLYWMQVLTGPNALGRQVVLRRNPNASGNFFRRGWRVNVSLDAKVRRAGAMYFVEGRTKNLSLEGVFLESTAGFAAGELVDLQLTFPDRSLCALSARVSRRAPTTQANALSSSTDWPVIGMGLYFLKMPPETRAALTRFLWRAVRELPDSGIQIHHD
jgi:hypothetical protein